MRTLDRIRLHAAAMRTAPDIAEFQRWLEALADELVLNRAQGVIRCARCHKRLRVAPQYIGLHPYGPKCYSDMRILESIAAGGS